MAGKRRQTKLFDDNLDPYMVQIADRFIELIQEEKVVKDQREAQGKNLLGLLKKAGKQKIRHGGVTIEITETKAKEKIRVKGTPEKKKTGK